MLPLSVPAAKAVGTGQVQMIVKYAGVPIWTQLDDLCDKAACPISAGPTEVRRPASSCPELLPAVSAFVAPEMPAAASGAVNCRPACSQRAAGWQQTWHRRKSTHAEGHVTHPSRRFRLLAQVHYSQPFPAITPPGYYSVTLDGHAGTEQLFCVRVDFQVGA